jgi:hypothetical protein
MAEAVVHVSKDSFNKSNKIGYPEYNTHERTPNHGGRASSELVASIYTTLTVDSDYLSHLPSWVHWKTPVGLQNV